MHAAPDSADVETVLPLAVAASMLPVVGLSQAQQESQRLRHAAVRI
ncbi:MAG: hypothetical protein RL198_910 [Actinomycetota bacterium]